MIIEKLQTQTEQILIDRFGKDSIIALATALHDIPYVRYVNSFYYQRAFYVLTHGLSGKMKQIHANPQVAISGDWFTAQGSAVNLGSWNNPENAPIAQIMSDVFSSWLSNNHMNLQDPNACILRIDLTHGVLLSHGTRYEIDFTL